MVTHYHTFQYICKIFIRAGHKVTIAISQVPTLISDSCDLDLMKNTPVISCHDDTSDNTLLLPVVRAGNEDF